MWKLTVKYTDYTLNTTYHQTEDEAIWFLHNEGDHVAGFTLKEKVDETTQPIQPGTETL